jgi:hypothetical protein
LRSSYWLFLSAKTERTLFDDAMVCAKLFAALDAMLVGHGQSAFAKSALAAAKIIDRWRHSPLAAPQRSASFAAGARPAVAAGWL